MNEWWRPFGRCNNAGRTPSEVVRHFSPHLFEHPGQFLDARGSGTGTRCPVRQNDRAKKLGDRKIGKVSRLWRTRATRTESRVMRRIVETQRQESRDGDSRNPKILALAWSMETYFSGNTGSLILPLFEVPRTGIRQPPGCGMEPTPIGQSMAWLPGNQRLSAWLSKRAELGSDQEQAGQNSRSSQSEGKPSTRRRAVGEAVGASCHMKG